MTYTTDFEKFWQGLPKPMKKGKGYAFECFGRLMKKKDCPTVAELSKAVRDQKKERAFLKRQNRFVPEWKNASTWINQGCWEDDCEMPIRVTKAAHNSPGNGVDLMVRGLNILTNLGESKFQDYCKQAKMPQCDIEAVRFKFSGKYNVESLARGIG